MQQAQPTLWQSLQAPCAQLYFTSHIMSFQPACMRQDICFQQCQGAPSVAMAIVVGTMKSWLLCAGGLDAPEPVTGRKGSFAAAAAFVLPPPEEPEAEVATPHLYQARQARFLCLVSLEAPCEAKGQPALPAAKERCMHCVLHKAVGTPQ